jgi:hypothetical protein
MEELNLNKKVYAKNQYKKVIDTNFTQLAKSPTAENIPEPASADTKVFDFFQSYTDLFFDIPKLGDTNSHEYLAKTSAEYVGSALVNNDIQALIEEINQLQQQNLDLNQQLIDLQLPK